MCLQIRPSIHDFFEWWCQKKCTLDPRADVTLIHIEISSPESKTTHIIKNAQPEHATKQKLFADLMENSGQQPVYC